MLQYFENPKSFLISLKFQIKFVYYIACCAAVKIRLIEGVSKADNVTYIRCIPDPLDICYLKVNFLKMNSILNVENKTVGVIYAKYQ